MQTEKFSQAFIGSILDGRIRGERDKGGLYSPEYGVWIDNQLQELIEKMGPPERQFVERFIPIAFMTARLFSHQIRDGEQRRMWPEDIFNSGGATFLTEASKINPSLNDPYTVADRGLLKSTTPYSRAYSKETSPLRQFIAQALEPVTQSSVAHRVYFRRLARAFEYDPQRESDLPFIRNAEEAWVDIPSSVPLLALAGPCEVYYDPARIHFSGNREIGEWARQIAQENELGPWRTFFEARLLSLDESMVDQSEVESIRRSSKQLFDDQHVNVPVSTEFRRVLIASGNGSHPMKTAKNYPNFNGIRDSVGYKNIHYTNMIQEGTVQYVKPWFEAAFGSQKIEDAQLIRGRALGIVGHEENHPFRRFDGDQEMEELKATSNGLWAVITSNKFSEVDIHAMLVAELGSLLYGRAEITDMRQKGDSVGAGSRATYHFGDTIFMNMMQRRGVFEDGWIHYDRMVQSIKEIVEGLEIYRQTGKGMLADETLQSDNVWDIFIIKQVE